MCAPVPGHAGAHLPFLGIHDGRAQKGGSSSRRHGVQAACLLITLGALLFLRAAWEQPSSLPDHSDLSHPGRPQRQARLRGLVDRFEKTLKHEATVEVEELFGNFGLSRESLFGLLDDKALYAGYHENDYKFMHDLKLAIRAKTRAKNIVIVRPDSLITAEELVSSAVLRFAGGINVEYKVMAFNGGGSLDRRGKAGGHRNWSFNGYFERDGMYVTFYNQSLAGGSCTVWGDCAQGAVP